MKTTNPLLNSLSRCLELIVARGYTGQFHMTNRGLELSGQGKRYGPYEASVIAKLSFENIDRKNKNSVIYVIETNDGVKGMWIDDRTK